MTTTTRDEARRETLAANGWGDASEEPLPGDASRRRYVRLRRKDGATAMLMDAPPAAGEDVRPFAALAAWLRQAGFSAPDVYAGDAEHGFLLLEDLGDAVFARVASERPHLEATLYEAAVDALAALHAGAVPRSAANAALGVSHDLAPYDRAAHLAEADLLTWAIDPRSARVGRPPRDDWPDYRAACADALGDAADARSALVLRDYHAENLMWLPERGGVARVGLLDFQDALIGHPAYDLVSLLEDARRDVAPVLADAMIARYVRAAAVHDEDAFRRAYASLGAIRNVKIIGVFNRLAHRDGKLRYLSLIPRVVAHLRRDLAALGPCALSDWLSAAGVLDGAAPSQPRRRESGPVTDVMVLCAGKGTRMRPLTDHTPKPLLKIAGRSLLDRALDRASEIGVERGVVNASYLAEQIDRAAAARSDPPLVVSHEGPEPLETGGGVKRASALLRGDAFLVMNADAVWSAPTALAPLRDAWRAETMDALLLLVPWTQTRLHHGAGDFFLDLDGRLRRRGGARSAPYVYTGAQIIARHALDGAPDGAFSLNIVWDALIARGRAYGAVCGGLWVDVGTPDGLTAAERLIASAAKEGP